MKCNQLKLGVLIDKKLAQEKAKAIAFLKNALN